MVRLRAVLAVWPVRGELGGERKDAGGGPHSPHNTYMCRRSARLCYVVDEWYWLVHHRGEVDIRSRRDFVVLLCPPGSLPLEQLCPVGEAMTFFSGSGRKRATLAILGIVLCGFDGKSAVPPPTDPSWGGRAPLGRMPTAPDSIRSSPLKTVLCALWCALFAVVCFVCCF